MGKDRLHWRDHTRHSVQSTSHSFSSSPSSSFHISAAHKMVTLQELDTTIAEQSVLFNQLKAEADPAKADELVAARDMLGELKKSRGALLRAAGVGNKDKKKERLLLVIERLRGSS